MEEFGKNLRFYRKQRRLTQTELASQVGVAPAYVSQIESALRMPSLKVARKFAECLSVELPILLGTPEATRTGDQLTDAQKLEALRGLIRSIEFDQDHRPQKLELECYPGARGTLITEDDVRSVRLHVFLESEPGGEPRTKYSHPGRERVHCATGRVRVYWGDEEVSLEAGETYEFDATIPHVLSGGAATVVVSTTEPRVTADLLEEIHEADGGRDSSDSLDAPRTAKIVAGPGGKLST